jgi:rRNA maturation RNase YbeY
MAPLHIVENSSATSVSLDPLRACLSLVCEIEEVSQPVNVMLMGSQELRELNKTFRGVDADTDVLTFPSGQALPFPLGDIAISLPYANRQAALRGVSTENELVALIVHGVLHLVGYDDETEEDRLNMQIRMNEIGETIGTPIDAHWTSVLHQEEE